MHCCSTVFTEVLSLTSFPTLVTWLAKRTCISEYYETEIQRRFAVQYVLQQNVQAKSIDNLKLPTVVLFVEFNTTMALAILTEQRDFVGAGVGQSCRCETAQGDQSFSVTPCSSADTA